MLGTMTLLGRCALWGVWRGGPATWSRQGMHPLVPPLAFTIHIGRPLLAAQPHNRQHDHQ